MMRWIVGSSLKFRGLVVAVAAGLLFLGVRVLPNAPVDTLPEFLPPTVEVQTEALGLSAEEVEQLITVPLEQDLLVGVAFLDEIESVSLPGLSSVVLTFEPGTDLLDARQVVAERLTQAVGVAGLPEVAKPPQMLQPLSSTSRVAMVQMSSNDLSLIEMSVLARWVVSPRLVGVEGVANVSIWGFRDRQLQVLVDPEHLAEQSVTLNQVIRTAGNALEVSPLSFLEASSPGTGGFIDTVNQRLHVFHEQAISTPDQLAQVPVEDTEGEAVLVDGQPLLLGDVAEIVEDHQPLIGDALCQDDQCLLLVIEKFPAANTPEVSEGVEAALAAMRPGLAGVTIDSAFYRPANYIDAAFGNFSMAFAIGVVLLALLLAVFTGWRSTLISVVAIALSLAVAGLVLRTQEAPINLMVVAGLVLALGAVIGDAVLSISNTIRRLRQHGPEGAMPPRGAMVRESVLDMGSSAVFAGVLIVTAAIPAFFIPGQSGAFLPPVVTSYILALASSLLVALTVVPALSLMLLRGAGHDSSSAMKWLEARVASLASGALAKPSRATVLLVLIVLAGLVVVPFARGSLSPGLRERDVLIRQAAAPGTSLGQMNQITRQMVDELSALPGVGNVGAHVGRAITSDQLVNVNEGEIWVSIAPDADYDTTLSAIEEVASGNTQISSDVLTYSEQRITTVLQGRQEEVVVRVYGQEPTVLETQAEQVRSMMAAISGIDQPQVQLPANEPIIEVEVDLDRAQAAGIKPGDVRRAAAVLLSGITVGNLFEEQKVFDVVVWGTPAIRQTEDDVRNLLIDTPTGEHVRVGEVADVRVVPRPTVIRHESVERYLDVAAGVNGRSLNDVLAEVDRGLAGMEFAYEYHAELLSAPAEQRAAQGQLALVTLAVIIGVLLLLQAAFSSWRLALLAFLTLPVALAGGVLALLLDGRTLRLGSLAGFLAIIGFTTRNGIAMIKRYQRLEREGVIFGPEVVNQGTRELGGSILITAIATAVVIIPMAVMGNRAGLEIVQPMALVMFGGLVTSTLVALLVLPALYLRFGFVSEPDLSSEELAGDITGIPDLKGAEVRP